MATAGCSRAGCPLGRSHGPSPARRGPRRRGRGRRHRRTRRSLSPGDRGAAGRARRALDSTVLDDAVATQDTVTQVIAAARWVSRIVPDGWALIAEVTSENRGGSGHDYTTAGKPRISWDDEAARAD